MRKKTLLIMCLLLTLIIITIPIITLTLNQSQEDYIELHINGYCQYHGAYTIIRTQPAYPPITEHYIEIDSLDIDLDYLLSLSLDEQRLTLDTALDEYLGISHPSPTLNSCEMCYD